MVSHFHDSAVFTRYIRDWFNTVNVKSKDYGKRTLDKRRNAIRRDSMNDDLSYLLVFMKWLENWQSCDLGLSKQTFQCAIRTCKCFLELVPYLFNKYSNIEYILLGNISSDFLEGRS